jgi:hypothetical protein
MAGTAKADGAADRATKAAPTASFLAEAAAVMNSPYWRTPGGSPREAVAVATARAKERSDLLAAFQRCTSADALPAKARAIYDRALAALGG